MFSSWDLVRPHFWHPMSTLEQSMMELEQVSDMIMRPRIPFSTRRTVLAAPKYVDDGESSDDDDDFFVDLPIVARKYTPTAFQLEVVPEVSPEDNSEQESMEYINTKKSVNANSDTDTSTDMDVDDEGKTSETANTPKKPGKAESEAKDKGKRRNKSKKPSKQLRKHSYKVAPTAERKITPKKDTKNRTFSSYSFSNSSVVDDQGRRVTTTRRRYEDSTGRLKAAHEREIDDKKMRTTWSRQSKEDEGQHESICSSGSPEEFEALWQQTPFGEAQKKTVKGQLQSESDLERER
ncbi:hypothetical protein PC117_g4574 [Phytophthora cactorum]|uniref:Uncharacterized protein n=1 Tax=Phytophthora cactorum TaxID=29920 RepID=A0A8T1EEW7_9STRA|nr:hypothetical protein PC117_g4574 [Phytophthora cactorum]